MKCLIDFETRSEADLGEVGLFNYARHPSTDIWCLAYAFDEEPVRTWQPDVDAAIPEAAAALESHVANGGTVVAHNVGFELAVWNHILAPRYGFPPLHPDQCQDTMALSLHMAHPASLEKAVKAARLNIEKDMDGHRLMMRMARPRKFNEDGTAVWWDQQERIDRLVAYCERDIAAERALYRYADPLPESEQELVAIDYEINQRGIYIDRPLAEAALALADRMRDRLDVEMSQTTGGWVRAVSNAGQLGDWLRHVGIPANSVAKDKVAELLTTVTDPTAQRALQLRQQGAKSSTAKIQKLLSHAGPDNRIRGTMQYHAASTGRWGGRVLQPQNLPRPEILKDDAAVEEAIVYVKTGDIAAIEQAFGPPMVVLADLLRGLLSAPPGHDLMAADWSSVESRMLAWLAGEDWLIQAYRDFDEGKGAGIYELTAASILGKTPDEIDKNERQAYGKVSVLACGYQGGVNAFATMAVTYEVHMADHYDTVTDAAPSEDVERAHKAYAQYGKDSDIAERAWIASEVVKLGWRRKHPAIVAYWSALEDAALQAMRSPGQLFACGPNDHRRVVFRLQGNHLYCRLPSGRKLCYPWPELRKEKTPWGVVKELVTYECVSPTGHWWRTSTHGGKLAENVVSGSCADLLRHSLKVLRPTRYQVAMHVHDEIVVEIPQGFGSTEELAALMCEQPAWTDGLPLAASAWRGPRFKKD